MQQEGYARSHDEPAGTRRLQFSLLERWERTMYGSVGRYSCEIGVHRTFDAGSPCHFWWRTTQYHASCGKEFPAGLGAKKTSAWRVGEHADLRI